MVTDGLTTTRTQDEKHGSTLRFGWKLHHDTRKQNHQHATTTRERPRKNNRILRTHHHQPRSTSPSPVLYLASRGFSVVNQVPPVRFPRGHLNSPLDEPVIMLL